MQLYGITGSIGAGKSAVVNLFRQAGVPAIECDRLGHELLSGGELAQRVLERHPRCRLKEGGVDRRSLAKVVFSRPQERKWLESLLHPAIWQRVQDWSLTLAGASFALVEGAVLLESPCPQFGRLAGLLLVTAPWPVRLERVLRRDGCSKKDVLRRSRWQMAEAEKLLSAHLVIDNSGPLEQTRLQVEAAARLLREECGGGL